MMRTRLWLLFPAAGIRLALLAAAVLAGSSALAPGQSVWIGEGSTVFWSDTGNWQAGSPPGPDEDLTFSPGTRTESLQDLGALSVNSLTFSDSRLFTIEGSPLDVLPFGSIHAHDDALVRIEAPVHITDLAAIHAVSSVPFGFTPSNVNLFDVSGNGGLYLYGSGTTTIGQASYTGTTEVTEGKLRVGGNVPDNQTSFFNMPGNTVGQGSYFIYPGATLTGGGSIGLAPGNAVNIGGKLAPGIGALTDTAPLAIDGIVVFQNDSMFEFEVNSHGNTLPADTVTIDGSLTIGSGVILEAHDYTDIHHAFSVVAATYENRVGGFAMPAASYFAPQGLNSRAYTITYTSGENAGPGQVILNFVPEPASWLLALSGLAGLLFAQRRTKRRTSQPAS